MGHRPTRAELLSGSLLFGTVQSLRRPADGATPGRPESPDTQAHSHCDSQQEMRVWPSSVSSQNPKTRSSPIAEGHKAVSDYVSNPTSRWEVCRGNQSQVPQLSGSAGTSPLPVARLSRSIRL